MIPIIKEISNSNRPTEYKVQIPDSAIASEAIKLAEAANRVARAHDLTGEEYYEGMPEFGRCEISEVLSQYGCECANCVCQCTNIFRHYTDEYINGIYVDIDTFVIYTKSHEDALDVDRNILNQVVRGVFMTAVQMAREISNREFRVRIISEIFGLANDAGVEL